MDVQVQNKEAARAARGPFVSQAPSMLIVPRTPPSHNSRQAYNHTVRPTEKLRPGDWTPEDVFALAGKADVLANLHGSLYNIAKVSCYLINQSIKCVCIQMP